MNNQSSQRLKLSISNPTQVGSGSTADHVFSASGGSIGTARNDTWRLSSHRTGAVAGHAEIRLIDGEFCLIDRSGRTFINSGTQPVGRGRRARLTTGDLITVGRYQLQAQLVTGTTRVTAGDAFAEDGWNDLVESNETELQRRHNTAPAGIDHEPLSGLQPAPAARTSDDPLAGFSVTSEHSATVDRDSERLLTDQPDWRGEPRSVTDEYRDNRDVALGLPVMNGRSDRMSEPQAKPATEVADTADTSRRHISGAPLMRGLAAELDFQDSEDMRLFMEEAGQTLKATIDGLLALHQSEDSRHQALRTRLQPIEDNPLRLGQSCENTVQTLFASQRSPVHLSAPAAVNESLQGLRHHQLATQAATSEALDAILHAFSPKALLRRFHGYRRGIQDGEDEPQWAWQMYQHYYEELSSSRQQGFERLFQEVFDQAYDHHLRQLQRESI